jgi:hypothetical protein
MYVVNKSNELKNIFKKNVLLLLIYLLALGRAYIDLKNVLTSQNVTQELMTMMVRGTYT